MEQKLSVAIIGCGAIGTTLAKAIDEGRAGSVELIAVYDIDKARAVSLVEKLSRKPLIAESFEEIVQNKDIQLVIEAASQEAVRQYAKRILEGRKDLMMMSVGALTDESLLSELRLLAEEEGRRIYVPSGAIAALDGLKSAIVGKVNEVVLTTRKPVKALAGAPFFSLSGMDYASITKETLLYEGNAIEACKLFPSNVNVAAALSLAGLGPEKTRVRIIADPSLERIIHEITVKGDFGKLTVRTENVPSPESPRTSYLAALSAIATLRKIAEPLVVGT